jgi:tripartite-type tricarboxylate transporter receptor subunit TctC
MNAIARIGVVCAVLLAAAAAQAQGAYPSRPVRVLVPFAPAERLHGEIVKIVVLPEVQERLAVLGFVPVGNTPQEFASLLRAELPRWGKVIRDAKIPKVE